MKIVDTFVWKIISRRCAFGIMAYSEVEGLEICVLYPDGSETMVQSFDELSAIFPDPELEYALAIGHVEIEVDSDENDEESHLLDISG